MGGSEVTEKIRIGIVGYGNLGRGVELAVAKNPDMELVAVFTRRPVEQVNTGEQGTLVLNVSKAHEYTDQIDVMILCGGSATDLPQQGPEFAAMFNTVDSFDTHSRIPEYFALMDKTAKAKGKLAAISIGWDPGLFSLQRLMTEALLPGGKTYTFWGRGVSQGHSDAIRRIPGVKNAVQYTIPISAALDRVRAGEQPELAVGEQHLRDCYVVAEEGADQDRIAAEIKAMPNYFADYETKVTFITEEELLREHSQMPHGGLVIRSATTGRRDEHHQVVEFSLRLDSNPEFTASVLVAYARAVYRLHREGKTGAVTIFDIPVGYLSMDSPENLRQRLL